MSRALAPEEPDRQGQGAGNWQAADLHQQTQVLRLHIPEIWPEMAQKA